MYRQEVKDIFMNTDPQMAMEVEYDLRQFDLQQQQQKQQARRMTYGPSDVQSAPMSPQATATRAPQTPQEEMLEASHTIAHKVQPREVSSEEARRETSESSTLIFSPSQGHPANENWNVTAKSPSVDKPQGRRKKSFTQQDLEGRMQKDLAAAFDSASDSDDIVPPSVNTSRRRAKAKTKAKAKSKKTSTPTPEEEDEQGHAEDDEEQEEVVPLPLKKKAKKKTKTVKKSDVPVSTRPKRKRK
ncbi:Condensin-2 complex subunit D3 [Phytophthora palmivora]|uniref:Condensin-2 complex subunit D3 n=1 Tax=Phytophthora palmivora TaxID=4796 RepID=A0A2P4Y8R2_9STRA|nr:Condensin-2 complex subunit D3 [Phytophthora palmivora]